MPGLSFITKGILCSGVSGDVTVINRYILPMDLEIKSQQNLDLQIKPVHELNLNAEDICDKNINLKITEQNINIKKDSTNINIGE